MGDFSGDGAVDVSDLAILAGQYGMSPAPSSGASSTTAPQASASPADDDMDVLSVPAPIGRRALVTPLFATAQGNTPAALPRSETTVLAPSAPLSGRTHVARSLGGVALGGAGTLPPVQEAQPVSHRLTIHAAQRQVAMGLDVDLNVDLLATASPL